MKLEYIELGWHDLHWYIDTKALFVELYGLNELPLVANLFAATSINSSLESNIRLFRKAYYELKNGLPFSSYLPVMKLQLERIRAGEEISGPKIQNFARAMQGDPDAVVVDIWLLRAFNLDKQFVRSHSGRKQSAGASLPLFNKVVGMVKALALKYEVQPAQMSAVIWSGVREYYTGKKLTRYDLILRTQEYNMFETKT